MASDSTTDRTPATDRPSPMASDFAIDPASHFYIHPNENLALILVAPPLDGSNYHGWARAMRIALLSKNKLKFVDGSILPPPSTNSLFLIWERYNNLVQGWLTRYISPTIAKSILWFNSAHEIWTDLRSRFSQSDLFRVADLQEEICNLRQGDLTMSDYFTRLKILWDELANIHPLKPCPCGSVTTALTHHEEDQVIRFLKGLNEQFASVKSQIMLLYPLPLITRVFSLVLQQERELHLPTDSKVLLARTPRYASSGSKVKQCSFYGRPCHTEDTCYRKHGFPPGFKFRSFGSPTTVNHFSIQASGIGQQSSPALVSPPITSSS